MIDRIKADSQALAAAEAGEWESCATRLNAIAQPTRKPESQARKTWVGLQDLFGFDQATALQAKLLDAIDQATLVGDSATRAKLSLIDKSLNVGYDLGNPKVQEQLDELGQSGLLTTQEVLALKAIGAEKPVVTAQDCRNAWGSENEATFDAWFNEFVSPLLYDKTAAKAAIIAKIGEW